MGIICREREKDGMVKTRRHRCRLIKVLAINLSEVQFQKRWLFPRWLWPRARARARARASWLHLLGTCMVPRHVQRTPNQAERRWRRKKIPRRVRGYSGELLPPPLSGESPTGKVRPPSAIGKVEEASGRLGLFPMTSTGPERGAAASWGEIGME